MGRQSGPLPRYLLPDIHFEAGLHAIVTGQCQHLEMSMGVR